MHRRRFLTGTGAAVLATGCLGGGQPAGTDSPTPSPTETAASKTVTGSVDATVEIRNFRFLPQNPAVDPGGRVRWVNEHVIDHRVVSVVFIDEGEEWEFDSGVLAEGDEAAFTFDEPGVYHFYCESHGEDQNCGAVVVGDASQTEDLPCNEGML